MGIQLRLAGSPASLFCWRSTFAIRKLNARLGYSKCELLLVHIPDTNRVGVRSAIS